MNSLRKSGGDISTKSKLLVKKWKELLVESEPVTEQPYSQLQLPTAEASQTVEERSPQPVLSSQPVQEVSGHQSRKHSKKHHHRHRHHHSPDEASEYIAASDYDTEVETASRHKHRTLKRKHGDIAESDDFSKALTVPLPYKKVKSSAERTMSGGSVLGKGHQAETSRGEMSDLLMLTRDKPASSFITKERSPLPTPLKDSAKPKGKNTSTCMNYHMLS